MEFYIKGDGDQCGVSRELPLDMMKEIFGKLSIEQFSGCRMVCKEWNSKLSSEIFLSSLPAEEPWLLICGVDDDESLSCMAYCFSTKQWRTFSLSFLPNPGRYRRYLATTAQGLLLFRETPTPKLCVCNPLTRSYAEIEIDVTDKLIHLVKGTKGQPYLVVCSEFGIFSFQIYHYFQDSWRIKLQFAGETGCNIIRHEMVECNGVLFWEGTLQETAIIVGYNIQDGFINPVTVASLPLELVEDWNMNVVSMVAYGSSVLVVSCRQTGIIIWELFQDQKDKLLWKWKEFTRMTPESLPEYLKGLWHEICICVGDYLCFSRTCGFRSVDVFAYNLKEGVWQLLPLGEKYFIRKMMSYERKLNLYQILR